MPRIAGQEKGNHTRGGLEIAGESGLAAVGITDNFRIISPKNFRVLT
jgi:hypothetical protein